MGDDNVRRGEFKLSDFKWEATFTTPTDAMPTPPPAPIKVTGQAPAPGKPDMDWTEPFLERGTTFSLTGAMQSDPIPVERAWVKDEVLYFEGTVTLGGENG